MSVAIQGVTDAEEITALLQRTGLAIIIAGELPDVTASFHAAHGLRDSVLVLTMNGERNVWTMTGGDKRERVRRTDSAKAQLCEKAGFSPE